MHNEVAIRHHHDDDDVQPHFRPLSTWMPPKGGDAALETFIQKFRADVKQQLEANQPKTWYRQPYVR